MVALDPFVPLLDRVRLGHHLPGQRREGGQALGDRWPGSGPRGRLDRPLAAPSQVPVQGGQGQDAEPLQPLHHAQGELDAVVALRRLPAPMLANRVTEFAAAQLGKAPDGLLDGGDLFAGEALAEKGSRLQALDARVHGCLRASIPTLADSGAGVSPWRKIT